MLLKPKEQNTKSPLLHASKPQIERFVGHFWGRSQKSYASAVKLWRALVVAVKMQPKGMGRRGGARGSGRGFGREHVL
jgi:hypothetical protein